MPKHWLVILAISVSMSACDDSVNIECNTSECLSDNIDSNIIECEPGQVACYSEGQIIVRCDNNGNWDKPESCQERTQCDAEAKACVKKSCDNVQRKCDIESENPAYLLCKMAYGKQSNAWMGKFAEMANASINKMR